MTIKAEDGKVTISTESSSVEILEFGATVISWKVNGQEKLWLSSGSKLDGSRAVRGGIPLVFPRFGPARDDHPQTAKLPQHGFARSVFWEFLGQVDETTAQFGLGPEQLSKEFKEAWPYDFTLVYTVSIKSDDTLKISLDVENTGPETFDFNVLFHTYFAVPEVEKTSVHGLSGLRYWNKVTSSQIPEEKDSHISFAAETDRVYENSPSDLEIQYNGKRLFEITAKNTLDTVVWNPWTETAKSMSDFEPKDGFHKMVCVENGSVAKFAKLEPSKSWSANVTIRAVL